MPANLTPQYLQAEAEYKKAQTPEDRLAALKRMWALLPKHKGTDKLQADIKARMSELRKEIEEGRKAPKRKGLSHKIPRQGAGQYVLLGGPNTGKSTLLATLTKAHPQVAPYPFTTHAPQAGMMPWEDTQVQLIDLPPITSDYIESYVSSMARSADAALLFVDLGDDDGPFAAEAVIDQLAERKTILTGNPPEEVEEFNLAYVRTMLVANKLDLPGAEERLEIVREMYGERFPIHAVSLTTGKGVEELRDAIYKFLRVIRVYTKQPGKPPDLNEPFTCPEGSTVIELAALIHRDFEKNLKTARIWGTGVYDGQAVGREHVLHDKDIVELHT